MKRDLPDRAAVAGLPCAGALAERLVVNVAEEVGGSGQPMTAARWRQGDPAQVRRWCRPRMPIDLAAMNLRRSSGGASMPDWDGVRSGCRYVEVDRRPPTGLRRFVSKVHVAVKADRRRQERLLRAPRPDGPGRRSLCDMIDFRTCCRQLHVIPRWGWPSDGVGRASHGCRRMVIV
jgi:hypothetical protein